MKKAVIICLIVLSVIILLPAITIYSLRFAEDKISVSYCSKIKDLDYNQICLAIIKQNPTLCGQIQDQDSKNRCYNYVAIINQDSYQCERIEGKKQKDWCYYYVSRIKQDISLCGEIGDESLKNDCENKTKIETNHLF